MDTEISMGTRDYGLVFGGQPGGFEKNSRESYGGSGPLEGFVDANYVGDLDARRSTMGSMLQPILSYLLQRSSI